MPRGNRPYFFGILFKDNDGLHHFIIRPAISRTKRGIAALASHDLHKLDGKQPSPVRANLGGVDVGQIIYTQIYIAKL